FDVTTHEFGHALASSFISQYGDWELNVGSMETAECHSMSMEFFAWKYTDKFFGDMANAYRKKHLLDSLSFIPYGVIVDEFQHIMYENPDMTPAQRKEVYRKLEATYRPYMSYEGLPYLEEGTRWQYQMHIYESPFYYIDYCLAQTVAIHFLIKSQENYEEALNTYLNFVKQGGTKRFSELVKEAGIPSPFEDGALETMSQKALEIIEKL
ncbi:MAG: M3 family oligoendopeptidase, partial [Clostridia bacterium]|nr:M3 family oligoendopeptidase [Clostridia bacterium]